jgi:hypothetical protein
MVDDLKYANAAGIYVEIMLLNGEKMITDVREVNEEQGFVSLGDPQQFGDTTTSRKVGLDLIASVTVTDITL